MVFIGAENIISPLGKTAEENFEALLSNRTGLKLIEKAGNRDEALYISIIDSLEKLDIVELAVNSIQTSLSQLNENLLDHPGNTILIISTTKR